MAASITIYEDLATFNPVYNRMEVLVTADALTLALTGMRYVFDVYIEGQSFGGAGYYRFTVPKAPTTSNGYVDIAGVCESFVNSTLGQFNNYVPFQLGSNANGTQSIIKVTIKYGYSYYLAGVYTVVPDVLTGTSAYAFQSSLTEQEFMGWTPTTYLCNITNGAHAQFLTDMKTNYVSLSNLGWHHILSDTPTDIDWLVVKTYNSSGTLIQTVTKAISVVQNLTSSRMYKVATGPKTLNNLTGVFVTGAQPIVTASVASYTVQLQNSAGTVASEILYFIMQEPCRYTQRRIHFENRFGSFDAFNFNWRSQEEQTSERKGYKFNKAAIGAAAITRLYQDQAQVTNYVKTQDTLLVRSEFLTTAQNTWLKQLISSTEIYLEFTDPTGAQNFLAYERPEGNSWIEQDSDIDKLFNMEVKLKLSQANYRQRR